MARPNAVRRVADWLREGYPTGVPEQDYVALLALLRRKLTEEEVEEVADRIILLHPDGSVPPAVVGRADRRTAQRRAARERRRPGQRPARRGRLAARRGRRLTVDDRQAGAKTSTGRTAPPRVSTRATSRPSGAIAAVGARGRARPAAESRCP